FLAAGAKAVAQGIEGSFEGRRHLVESWYGRFLARRPSDGEAQGLVDQLAAGAGEEQVLGGLLASDEFFNRAQTLVPSGTPNERFVRALYQLLLERPAGPSELTGWLNL